MSRLSPEGHRVIEDVALGTGFSPAAVTSMLFSVMAGRGGMAQFNHRGFGGSGQWMFGGAIMISDMFSGRFMRGIVDGRRASTPGACSACKFSEETRAGGLECCS